MILEIWGLNLPFPIVVASHLYNSLYYYINREGEKFVLATNETVVMSLVTDTLCLLCRVCFSFSVLSQQIG